MAGLLTAMTSSLAMESCNAAAAAAAGDDDGAEC